MSQFREFMHQIAAYIENTEPQEADSEAIMELRRMHDILNWKEIQNGPKGRPDTQTPRD